MSTPDVFEHSDYKAFVRAHIAAMPGGGRGEFRRIAAFLRTHPVAISQVFKGERDLTAEQAFELCEYLKLSEHGREYFLLMVQKARAGTHRLSNHYSIQMKRVRSLAGSLETVIPNEKTAMNDAEQRQFYSNWQYSAVRLYFSIKERAKIEDVARMFSISNERAQEIVSFLLKTGLCVRNGERTMLGPKVTHISADSPLIQQHRMNWRLKALERQPLALDEIDVSYSGLAAVSQQDAARVRKDIGGMLDRLTQLAIQSKSEQLMLLNIDWIQI